MFNKKIKKAAALLMTGVLMFSMAGCGKGGDNDEKPSATAAASSNVNNSNSEGNSTEPTAKADPTKAPDIAPSDKKRVIRVGTWYDHYYTSKHTDINDDPSMSDPELAQMRLDNVRAIEEKYNVEIEFVNLTWEGIIESVNTSIMAGTPDCDVYEVDLQFGVPAVLNGYAQSLESFISPDDDVFTNQTIFKNLTIAGQDKSYLFSGSAIELGGSFLAFNMDMINEVGLENPQDVYDRGEWTWDKYAEYLKKLTRDVDGDGNIDVYGYGGWWTTCANNLLMSNNAHVAGGLTEELSSPQTIEVLDYLYRLYQVEKTVRPWNEDSWDDNVSCYTEGKVAFWTSATWVQSQYGTSAQTGFNIGLVPWPVGPSGNKDTNSQIKVSGNWYMIPTGVERPELVYQVMYDYTNWFDGDLTLRDDTEWAENCVETERNFEYLVEMGKTNPWFDLWEVVTDLNAFQSVVFSGDSEVLTAAQAAEQNKQIVQDFLDTYMK